MQSVHWQHKKKLRLVGLLQESAGLPTASSLESFLRSVRPVLVPIDKDGLSYIRSTLKRGHASQLQDGEKLGYETEAFGIYDTMM